MLVYPPLHLRLGCERLDTRDNEGVQYGLKALLGGSITGESS